MSHLGKELQNDNRRTVGRRLRILFTEGSSVSAREALYDLGGRHSVDVLDPSRLCQCRFSRLARRVYRCPRFAADPCGYLKFLSARLAVGNYDVLLPLHDEIYLLSRVRTELAKRVAVAMADFPTVAVLQSKLRFLELARELELPCPETLVCSDPNELTRWAKYPAYLKLDVGTAGQTVRLVHDRGEVDRALDDFDERGWWRTGDPILLQQPGRGEQGVVRGIFNSGRLVGAHATALRVRGVGGSAVVREGVDEPIVLEHLRRIGERIGWHGALFGEYFLDGERGVPQFIEFNPRIGDSANAAFSGLDLMQQWVDVALGRDVDRTLPRSGVWTHASILILMSKAMEGASRRELQQEIGRQLRAAGDYQHSHDELTRPRVDWLSVLPYAWVAGRLLFRPEAASRMVHDTVKNYALSTDAAARIRALPQEDLIACLKA
jgi:predicted ATP-grasp superfamily ATP-dependent carboligase